MTKPFPPKRAFRRWIVRNFGRVVVLPAIVLTVFCWNAVVAHCEEKPSRLSSYAFYGALHSADFASTEIALARGGREANPMPGMQSIGGRAAWKTLALVGMSELDHVLALKKKKKAQRGVRVGVLLVTAIVVGHNLSVR